jgi:hypothetical protein
LLLFFKRNPASRDFSLPKAKQRSGTSRIPHQHDQRNDAHSPEPVCDRNTVFLELKTLKKRDKNEQNETYERVNSKHRVIVRNRVERQGERKYENDNHYKEQNQRRSVIHKCVQLLCKDYIPQDLVCPSDSTCRRIMNMLFSNYLYRKDFL